jgi:tripartite-type tricarboxylate transporter receptor subunit TctC
MALSDCPKCWDTPCTCGYMYKDMSSEKIERQIAVLQEALKDSLLKKYREDKSWEGPGNR